MKKTFKLEHPKIKVPRIVDSIRHEIKKSVKKERKAPLPDGAKYWGFDCKLGQSEESAVAVELSALPRTLDELVETNAKTIYVEITAKAVQVAEIPPAQED